MFRSSVAAFSLYIENNAFNLLVKLVSALVVLVDGKTSRLLSAPDAHVRIASCKGERQRGSTCTWVEFFVGGDGGSGGNFGAGSM